VGSRELPELEIRERLLSTLRIIDGGPSGGVGAEDPGTSTFNAKKRRPAQQTSKLSLKCVQGTEPG
jgi:hypothetical protein